MDNDIQRALERQPDYSESFTLRMECLRTRIASALGIPVYLQSDMNYSASQRLAIFLDGNYGVCDVSSDNCTFKLVFLVSSRGPFFTVVCFHKMSQNEWAQTSREVGCSRHETLIDEVSTVLEGEGLKLLSGEMLKEVVMGHTTLMDGAPATVFEILFSELVS